MRIESTSSRVASIAAKGVARPQSLTHDEIQMVCGSALTQAGVEPTAANISVCSLGEHIALLLIGTLLGAVFGAAVAIGVER